MTTPRFIFCKYAISASLCRMRRLCSIPLSVIQPSFYFIIFCRGLQPFIQTEVRGIKFFYKSGMLFIKLPSGRLLSYVKPRIGKNQFGGESVTYEGIGSTKKWERIESYGPKSVENIVQAISRDILCNAMKTLRHCFIVGHVHDELIIECDPRVDLKIVCEQMGRSPDWMPDILLRADGYETMFYKKD